MGAITDDDDSICGLNNFHNLNNSKSGFNTLLQLARQSVRQKERDGWTDRRTGRRTGMRRKRKRECKSQSGASVRKGERGKRGRAMINGAATCYA